MERQLVCKWFACVYAFKDGCMIKGWLDEPGPLNGPRTFCPIYKVDCIHASHCHCGHEGTSVCKK